MPGLQRFLRDEVFFSVAAALVFFVVFCARGGSFQCFILRYARTGSISTSAFFFRFPPLDVSVFQRQRVFSIDSLPVFSFEA